MATKKHSSTEKNETSPPVLTVVKQPSRQPTKTTAKRLRASIIEGTLGEDAGPYPPLPAYVQRAVDKKARELANEACDLMRESIIRNAEMHCFRGGEYEIFDGDEALEIVRQITLDSALAPIVALYLQRVSLNAEFLLSCVTEAKTKIDETLQQFKSL